MAGKLDQLVLEEILSEKQIHHVLNQSIGENVSWEIQGSNVKVATEGGVAGFLGDHMKIALHVNLQKGERKTVHLFLKCIPTKNPPKAKFIDGLNYFKREKLMYKVLDEICKDGPKPWCVKAYVYTDSVIVMPDLSVQGYRPQHFLNILDAAHLSVATTSLASFHAAYVNYETQKSLDLNRPYRISEDYSAILKESTFYDSPWLEACSKVSVNILKHFSVKSYHNLPDFEEKLTQAYVKACDSLTEYKDTVNVLMHKDLWVNNIMFKYENNVPVNAVLVNYQCMGYGPPAFDFMIFLYLTTNRCFRQVKEKDIFNIHYSTFVENLNEDSKKRLTSLGYDKENFLEWCEKGRMFGMLEAITLYPVLLKDPKTAQITFDDPDTFEKHCNEDRSEPVIAHANNCAAYQHRNLEITEEFVETFLLE